MFSDLSQQTIDLLNKVDITALSKTTLSQATNLNAFDLSGPALQLYPVLTPLRNKLPREVSDRGDLATRWKAVTGVNVTNIDMGVSPGKRSEKSRSRSRISLLPMPASALNPRLTGKPSGPEARSSTIK